MGAEDKPESSLSLSPSLSLFLSQWDVITTCMGRAPNIFHFKNSFQRRRRMDIKLILIKHNVCLSLSLSLSSLMSEERKNCRAKTGDDHFPLDVLGGGLIQTLGNNQEREREKGREEMGRGLKLRSCTNFFFVLRSQPFSVFMGFACFRPLL